jgi:hypothetical protein
MFTIASAETMPYSIQIDNNNHTVVKNTGKKDKEEKPVHDICGFYSSTIGALTKIARLKTHEKNAEGAVITIKEYIEELKTITNSLTNLKL